MTAAVGSEAGAMSGDDVEAVRKALMMRDAGYGDPKDPNAVVRLWEQVGTLLKEHDKAQVDLAKATQISGLRKTLAEDAVRFLVETRAKNECLRKQIEEILVATATELGCQPDNEIILQAARRLRAEDGRWQKVAFQAQEMAKEIAARSDAEITRLRGLLDYATDTDEYRRRRAENTRLREEKAEMLAVLQRWRALDGGAWHVDRHAADKVQLMKDTEAVIAKLEIIARAEKDAKQ